MSLELNRHARSKYRLVKPTSRPFRGLLTLRAISCEVRTLDFETGHEVYRSFGKEKIKVTLFDDSSPTLGTICPFCHHSKCHACVEVSSNILACCKCRARAINRLSYLGNNTTAAEVNFDDTVQLNTDELKDSLQYAPRIIRPIS